MNKQLDTSLTALRKAYASNDEGAINKASIDLIAALKDFLATEGPGGVGSRGSSVDGASLENSVIRLFQKILAELKSSDVPFTSGSPGRGGILKSLHVSGLDPDYDTKGVGAALMKRAAAGLNVRAPVVKHVEQDIGEFDHYQSQGAKVQKAANKRGATGGAFQSPNDPTAS